MGQLLGIIEELCTKKINASKFSGFFFNLTGEICIFISCVLYESSH